VGDSLDILRAPSFASLPWLVHGFSTRQGGVSTCYGGNTLNLGVTSHDTKANVERNRRAFLTALGATDANGGPWPLLQVRQIHSATVHRINAATPEPLAGDGLITNVPALLLAIKTADCVPVLVADVKRRVVGAFHAGWRGTVARIVEKGVGEMRRQFDSVPRDLRAAIGPSIRRCCYQVGPEVRAEFESQFAYANDLFEEVFDSNAIHVRYPLLFLNQRAPGHGDLGAGDPSRFGGSESASTAGRRLAEGAHQRDRGMHRMRHRTLLLPSRRVRQDRAHDGGHRHPAGVSRPLGIAAL
jgi:YfiH family protein